ncbi:MAG: hypothetical protein M3O15_14420, partial [Acidobacteriota bacterium]|nr:hypothetical protein [Acidobacteriota bacterium]
YRPLAAAGERARHALAFARGERVIVVVPRLVLGLAGEWRGTVLPLPAGRFRDELTGEEVLGGREARLAEILGRFPVALLVAVE